ncbi:MAG: phage tail protein [Bacteroidota bacterium]
MAVSSTDIKDSYPLASSNFKVSILADPPESAKGEENSSTPDPISIGCAEVKGLDIELEMVQYKDGLSFFEGIQTILSQPKLVKLSLMRGIIQNRSYFYDWMKSAYTPSESHSLSRSIFLDLCDEEGAPIIRWTAKNSKPLRLLGPVLGASSNEVAFEQIDLVASNLTIEYYS